MKPFGSMVDVANKGPSVYVADCAFVKRAFSKHERELLISAHPQLQSNQGIGFYVF